MRFSSRCLSAQAGEQTEEKVDVVVEKGEDNVFRTVL